MASVNVINTIVTQLGTQVVTLATGGTIATVLGTLPVTGTIQNVATVATILGTQIVSVVPGLSGLAGVSVSAVVSGTVTVGGTVTVSGLVGHSITGSVNIVSTAIVSLATGGSVAALDVGRTQVMMVVTATSIGISGTMVAFTVYQGGTQATAGPTFWVVPAGKTFRVLAQQLRVFNSVTTSPVNHELAICVSAAAPTWTSAVPIVAAVGAGAASAGVAGSACGIQIADIAAGVTVGIGYTIGTSGGTIGRAIVNGYLFP
jgi:hypothetical protein